MRRRPGYFVVGIDEVGRGALAGPVTVAAVCLPKGLAVRNPTLGVLRDSKKLSPAQRRRWSAHFKSYPRLRWKIARVYPRGVERLNVSEAANLAASRALAGLMELCELSARGPLRPRSEASGSAFGGKAENCRIFLDGGLYLKNRSENMRITSRKNAKNFRKDSRFVSRYFASTVVRGDEKITAIKIASIIAKVNRDGYMERLSKKYPEYGFDAHKGYGTKKHFVAIRKHGVSKTHRLTFLGKHVSMK